MAEPLGISVPITPAGGIDHRLPSETPVTAASPRDDGSAGRAAQSAPPTQLDLGTTVTAIVRHAAPAGTAGALPVGTQLLLRIVAVPSSPTPGLLLGRIVSEGGTETLVETPLGLLALQRRLALAAETPIAFERLAETPPNAAAADTPSRSGGWPALDEVLSVLTQTAPELATLLRAELAPRSGPDLAGTLLFLLGALYQGDWPGAETATSLAAAGRAELARRLSDDADELRRLGDDPTTGDWRVLTLPLLAGATVSPLRLFLRRRKPDAPTEDASRFAIEVELSELGPLQLDGMLRASHLILILRSHHALPAALRAEISTVFRRTLAGWRLTGDISFATAEHFALTPLSSFRQHVAVSV